MTFPHACFERSPHIEGELELEAVEELQLGLPPENWSLDDVKRSLLLVSDESWFREGQAMVDLRLFGPTRESTFRRVFFDVPGAIDGCLKVPTAWLLDFHSHFFATRELVCSG